MYIYLFILKTSTNFEKKSKYSSNAKILQSKGLLKLQIIFLFARLGYSNKERYLV